MLTFKKSVMSALVLTTLFSTTSAFAGFKPIEDIIEEKIARHTQLKNAEVQAYRAAAVEEEARQSRYDIEEAVIKINAVELGIPLRF